MLAALQAALDQEGAARQLVSKQAWAAARATEVAKHAETEHYRAAHDERMRWDERIRSILTAAQPVAAFEPGMARPASDGAIVNTIIEQSNQIDLPAIKATDVMIGQAGEPQALAGTGQNLGRPALAAPEKLDLQALALQASPQADRMTVAAKSWSDGAAAIGMNSQALYSQSMNPLVQISPNMIKEGYPSRLDQSLLAAFASGNDGAMSTERQQETSQAAAAEFIRNRGFEVAQRRADAQKSAAYVNPADYLREEEIVKLEERHAVAGLEGVDRNELRDQLMTAASKRLGTGGESDRARQIGLQKQLSSMLRDAPAREDVRTMEAGNDPASRSRATIPAEAFTSLSGTTNIRGRPAAIEGRQRFDPRAIVGQDRERLGADAERAFLEQVPIGGTRMPEIPAASMQGTSLPASERLLGIFEPARATVGGSSGQRIDTDRLARALEMFTQGLERFTSMGRLPALGAGGSQTASVPPALPAKPTPFISRTDSSATPF